MVLGHARLVRALLLGAGLAIMPAFGTGCVIVTAMGDHTPLVEQTVTASAPHEQGGSIQVRSKNGSIAAKRIEGKDVTVVAHLRMVSDERLKETTISVNRTSEHVLQIKAVPPGDHWKNNEGCSFEIGVPEGVPVDLRTSNGRVECIGMNGPSTLDTSNGAIVVKDHAGSLTLDTSNGKIEASGVSGPVHADSSNGSIEVRMASPCAGPIDLDTSNGSITLRIPSTYVGSFKAGTSNGGVRVPQALPAGVNGSYSAEVRKTSASVRMGEGGPSSKLDTSNGSITLTFTDEK